METMSGYKNFITILFLPNTSNINDNWSLYSVHFWIFPIEHVMNSRDLSGMVLIRFTCLELTCKIGKHNSINQMSLLLSSLLLILLMFLLIIMLILVRARVMVLVVIVLCSKWTWVKTSIFILCTSKAQ